VTGSGALLTGFAAKATKPLRVIMPAWKVTKLWSDKEIGEYRAYVAKEGPNKATQGLKCTCEDLAIEIVSEFAWKNGLPIFFANGAHDFPDGITPEEYSNYSDFLNEVQKTSAAIDVARIVDVVPKSHDSVPASLGVAKPGDLILLYNPIHHVQVVTSASPSEVKIVQGNTDRHLLGGGQDPRSPGYIGVIAAEKSYVLDRASGKWLYPDAGELFREENGRLRIWSFAAWNSRMIKYTVKNGDTFLTIARNVYGQSATPRAIAAVFSAVDGMVDSNGNPRVGLVLYLWK
jgi:hypothetical protein